MPSISVTFSLHTEIVRRSRSAASIIAWGWIEPGMWIGSRSQTLASTGSARERRPIVTSAWRSRRAARRPSSSITIQYSPGSAAARIVTRACTGWGSALNTKAKVSSTWPRRRPARKRPEKCGRFVAGMTSRKKWRPRAAAAPTPASPASAGLQALTIPPASTWTTPAPSASRAAGGRLSRSLGWSAPVGALIGPNLPARGSAGVRDRRGGDGARRCGRIAADG